MSFLFGAPLYSLASGPSSYRPFVVQLPFGLYLTVKTPKQKDQKADKLKALVIVISYLKSNNGSKLGDVEWLFGEYSLDS